MQHCNYRMKAILGAFWCLCGIIMVIITIVLVVTGTSSFGEAMPGFGMGLLFAFAGGWIFKYYWV